MNSAIGAGFKKQKQKQKTQVQAQGERRANQTLTRYELDLL